MSETFCKRILKLDKFFTVFSSTHDYSLHPRLLLRHSNFILTFLTLPSYWAHTQPSESRLFLHVNKKMQPVFPYKYCIRLFLSVCSMSFIASKLECSISVLESPGKPVTGSPSILNGYHNTLIPVINPSKMPKTQMEYL